MLTWQADPVYSLSEPAFTDSVDSLTTYPVGICGEKTVTLDVGSPAFVSLTPGTNPILDNFTLDYSQSLATSGDIATHTVSYTVVFKEYAAIAASSTGTFDLTIQCPSTPPTYTDSFTQAPISYDLLQDTSSTVPYPTIVTDPLGCFTVSWQIFR